MFYIGCHLSSAKGFEALGQTALSVGANVFQFFTRNPRGSKAKPLDPQDAKRLVALAKANGFGPLLAHAPYTLNAASADPGTREFAFQTMEDDLKRMEYLPGNLYNFHPGSHVGQGEKAGIRLITDLLNKLLHGKQTTTVLLETMSGKGSEIGKSFEELRRILDGVKQADKLGVCLDTCHVYDAGYDIVNDLDGVLDRFDKVIGLGLLKAVHLNDSLNPFASHKDRHAPVGEGAIGLPALAKIINHSQLKHLPFYLETPLNDAGHAEEIQLLKSVYKN